MELESRASAENSKVRVVFRLRPLSDGRKPTEMFRFYKEKPKVINIRDPNPDIRSAEHEFMFDEVLGVDTSQQEVFQATCSPLVDHVLEGFNACVFAYGQTGSGKTYSMFGPYSEMDPKEMGDARGVVSRSMEYFFTSFEKRAPYRNIALFVSFLELYNDQIRDLGKFYLDSKITESEKMQMGRGSKPTPRDGSRPPSAGMDKGRKDDDYTFQSLEIHENPNGTVYVKDLSVIPVTTVDEVMDIVYRGLAKRATFETQLNEVSSRSHTVFTLTVVQTDLHVMDGEVVTGMLNLVDLAGSERLSRSHSEGARLKETQFINKSLSTLGNVVMALDRGDYKYIPYRDSKLSRLLQDSLGGNSYTTLLACLNPSPDNYEECLSTLQFANRCRSVLNQPRINYMDSGAASQERRVKKLLTEVAELKGQLSGMQDMYNRKLAEFGVTVNETGEFVDDAKAAAETIKELNNKVKSTGGDPNAPPGVVPGAQGGRQSQSRGLPPSAGGVAGWGEQQKMIEKVQDNNKSLRQKLEKKKSDFKAVQERVKKEHERHQLEGQALKERIVTLANQLEVGRQDLVNALNQQIKSHEDEMNGVIVRNQTLLNEQNTLLRSIPESLKVRSELLQKAENMRAQGRAELEDEYRQKLRALDQSRTDELATLKQQYEVFLNRKTEELRKFINDYSLFHEKKTLEVDDLKRQLRYLYEYTQKVTTILENAEAGNYNIEKKSGIKSVRIPSAHKPAPLDLDSCAYIKKLIARADAFMQENPSIVTSDQVRHSLSLSRQSQRKASLAAAEGVIQEEYDRPDGEGMNDMYGAFAEGGFMGADDNGGAPGSARPRTAQSEVLELELHVDSMTPEQLKYAVQQLRTKVRASSAEVKNRQEITADEREAIEQQVLNDLSDHPTIEYIKQIETDNTRLRSTLQDESKKVRQLMVALNAKDRAMVKLESGRYLSSSGGTANNRAQTAMGARTLKSVR